MHWLQNESNFRAKVGEDEKKYNLEVLSVSQGSAFADHRNQKSKRIGIDERHEKEFGETMQRQVGSKNVELGKDAYFLKDNGLDDNTNQIKDDPIAQEARDQFQAPYQLALIFLTWIFFGFSFLMRHIQEENDVSIQDQRRVVLLDEQRYKVFGISGSLMSFGVVSLLGWQFFCMRKQIRIDTISERKLVCIMAFFLVIQVLEMEAFLLKKSLADCWVITAAIIQMHYVQSISRVSVLNLMYVGVSATYTIIRFQGMIEWEWQSGIYSLLVCTAIFFNQEKIDSKKEKQVSKTITSNQKEQRLNSLFYDIIGMIPEGVAIFDKNLHTVFCNKTIKDIFQCNKLQLNKLILNLSTNQKNNTGDQSPSPNNKENSQNSFVQQKQQQLFSQSNVSNPKQPQKNQSSEQEEGIVNGVEGILRYNQFPGDLPLGKIMSNQILSNDCESELIEMGLNERYKDTFIKPNNLAYENQRNTNKSSLRASDNIMNHESHPTFSKLQSQEIVSPLSQHLNFKGLFSNEQNQTSVLLKQNLSSITPNNIINEQPPSFNFTHPHLLHDINAPSNGDSQFFPCQTNQQVSMYFSSERNKGQFINSASEHRQLDADITVDRALIPPSIGQYFLENLQSQQQEQNEHAKPPNKQRSSHTCSPFDKPLIPKTVNQHSDEEEEDEDYSDIFNNFSLLREGGRHKTLLKKIFLNKKKNNEIIQGETKISQILSDLFAESAEQINTPPITSSPPLLHFRQSMTNSANPVSISKVIASNECSINNNHPPSNTNIKGQNGININSDSNSNRVATNVHQYEKEKTFFSQLNKNLNLGYMQFQEDMIKVQVRWKDEIFVLKFLLFEIKTHLNTSEQFILVLVDPLWKEYFNKRMEEVERYKMKMFASLSHELRTPLNCTISMLEGLEQFLQDPMLIEDYLYPALHSQKLLLNQINDILDFAQIDSGQFKYTFVDFNMEKLLQDCMMLIQIQANIKSLTLNFEFDDRLCPQVKSDPNRIRQILLNFLSNALKFTPENGSIKIKAEPVFNKESEGQQKYIKLSVQDTGIGMKPETLRNIFNAFNKTEYETEGMNSQGCGLGLSISQSISKGLCGAVPSSQQQEFDQFGTIQQPITPGIQVQSDFNHGSTFFLIIQDFNPRPLNQTSITKSNHPQFNIVEANLSMINEEEIPNSYISVLNDQPLLPNPSLQAGQDVLIQQEPFDQISKSPSGQDATEGIQNPDSACIVNESFELKSKQKPQHTHFRPLIQEHYSCELQEHDPDSEQSNPPISSSPQLQLKKQISLSKKLSPQNIINIQQQFLNSQQQQSEPIQQTQTNSNNQLQTVPGRKSSSASLISVGLHTSGAVFQPNNNNLFQQTPPPSSKKRTSLNSQISNFNLQSNPSSRIQLSSSKITNLSHTLTSKSFSKMLSASGFNGYHTKLNATDDQCTKLLSGLQSHIELSQCENNCASFIIVDDNQFNILALSRVLQVTFFLIIIAGGILVI